MWCVSVAWVESDIFHLHTCIQTYLNTCTSLLGSGLRSWSHVAFYASGFNLQSLGLPQCQTVEGKWPRASCFLEPISLSPSLFLLSPYFFFFLFSIFPSPFFFLVLASSPTHTRSETSEGKITIPVRCQSASWFIHTFLWSLTSAELLLIRCSDRELRGTLKPPGTSAEGLWLTTTG